MTSWAREGGSEVERDRERVNWYNLKPTLNKAQPWTLFCGIYVLHIFILDGAALCTRLTWFSLFLFSLSLSDSLSLWLSFSLSLTLSLWLSLSRSSPLLQAQDQVFVFPDIFVEKSSEEGEGSMEQMQKQFMEDEKQRQRGDPRRAGVTEWFGL